MPPCRPLSLLALSTTLFAIGCNRGAEPAVEAPPPAEGAAAPAAQAPEPAKTVAKAPTPPAKPADPGPGTLLIGAARMQQVDDADPKRGQRLELAADGVITARGSAMARLTPDGRMIVDGTAFLTLQKDGTVHLKGKPSGLRLEPGGARAVVEDGFTPRGPTPHGRGYSWFPVRIPVVDDDPAMVTGLTDSARRLAELARHLSQTRPTVGRPIITGFSQGGMTSFAVALHHPDAIRAAVPIAGALPTALWRGRGGPPIIAIHGDADRVVPYRRGRSLVDALAARGLPARLITLPGVAHRIPPKARSAVYDALAESLPSPGP